MHCLLSHVFHQTLHPETDSILRQHLEEAHGRLPSISSCGLLPNDTILFLSQSLGLLGLLADGLLGSRHMEASTSVAVQQQELENDLSEMDSFDNLIKTHVILRKVSERIHEAAKDVQLLWDEVLPPTDSAALPIQVDPSVTHAAAASMPILPTFSSTAPSTSEPCDGIALKQAPLQQANPNQNCNTTTSSSDPQSSDLSIENIEQWLGTLKARGKGTYTCPYKTKCSKGAVRENGEMVVFIRNSDFRAHLEKHLKFYRCNLPNCPTRKGFARRDQLVRHQQTVPHVPQD